MIKTIVVLGSLLDALFCDGRDVDDAFRDYYRQNGLQGSPMSTVEEELLQLSNNVTIDVADFRKPTPDGNDWMETIKEGRGAITLKEMDNAQYGNYEVWMYCYPYNQEDILGRCLTGVRDSDAEAVVLPVMKEMGVPYDAKYYSLIRTLVDTVGRERAKPLKIFGLLFDNRPNWDTIIRVLQANPGLYSEGMMVEKIGSRACYRDFIPPTVEQAEKIKSGLHTGQVRLQGQSPSLANPKNANSPMIYYIMREQNGCEPEIKQKASVENALKLPTSEKVHELIFGDLTPREIGGPGHALLNTAIQPGQQNEFMSVVPVFACFGGDEGKCYNVFQNHPERACSNDGQFFMFSPLEPLSNLIQHFAYESCRSIGKKVVDHFIYNVV